MGRRKREIPPCCKSYGLPLYCAAWAPIDKISPTKDESPRAEDEPEAEAEGVAGQGDQGGAKNGPISASPGGSMLVVLGGGGGEGRSGVPNALLLARFDLGSRSLADQPVFRMGTDAEVPYRMAVHPGGDGVICSFPKSCRWLEWNLKDSTEAHSLALKSSVQKLMQLEDVGLQLALAFNAEGSFLATGGEDGHLRVFKWPSMEIVLDQTDAHTTVKDLDFSSDSKFLVSVGQSGPCRIWDLTSSTVAASLPREDGEVFGFCKFSQNTNNNQILYITSMNGHHGTIVSYNPLSWTRIGMKRIARDAISAFSVSADGKFLAIGTVEGDIVIANSSDLRVWAMVKKAHLGIVTALVFSENSRALISTSFDSSARVTIIEEKRTNGSGMWVIVVVILLAILVYFMKLKGEL